MFRQNQKEPYFKCWECFKELLQACPHHGFESWRIIGMFYDGLTSEMRQFVETMCNGEFLSKNPDEAWEYLDSLAESAQNWDTSDGVDNPRQSNNPKGGGIYQLQEDEMELNAKVASLTRKIEAIELGRSKQPVTVCGICDYDTHSSEDCPTIPAF